MKIIEIDRTGHTETEIDITSAKAVQQAEIIVREAARRTLVVGKKGTVQEQIRAFDPTYDEIIVMQPMVGG